MLSQEQLEAKENIIASLPGIVTLGGYAGTGKTTVIKSLTESLDATVMAFTGKAAHVLRRKGVNASTIHSSIYRLITDDEGKPILDDAGSLQWELKPIEADCIIVDEASMIPEWIYQDLCSLQVPLIFVGDHGQLPPVGDSFNLMEKPDFTLETIHRSAGEIPAFAEFLRKGNCAWSWKTEGSVICGRFDIKIPDQVICGFNNTRKQTNAEYKGNTRFDVGDKIIILENKRKYKVFNGMQGIVTRIEKFKLTFSCDDIEYTVPFSSRNPETKTPHTVALAHAYCITCHKAQGDEWDTIGVIEEQCNYWEEHRWNYTAASRARKMIYWL